MKKNIVAALLVLLLFVTGCSQKIHGEDLMQGIRLSVDRAVSCVLVSDAGLYA